MPPATRRSTGGSRARPGPAKGQSTISFANRVTKPHQREEKKSLVSPTPKGEATVDDITIKHESEEEDVHEAEEDEQPIAEPVAKTEAETDAERITDAQVYKYWRSIEKERKAPRVHQQGLSTGEKVLRYFDVSSQYGPCIGMTRLKRWQRANKLDLNPPIEVLAVILKEETKGDCRMQAAHMDEILNSAATETT